MIVSHHERMDSDDWVITRGWRGTWRKYANEVFLFQLHSSKGGQSKSKNEVAGIRGVFKGGLGLGRVKVPF